jgi:hypothetical protein
VILVGVLVIGAIGVYLVAASDHGAVSGPATSSPAPAVLHQIGQPISGAGLLSGSKAGTVSCPEPASQCYLSFNWGGYVINGNGSTVSKVVGSWTVPSITGVSGTTCPDAQKAWLANAQWIGIDGFSSGTVEQTGTEVQCFYGSAQIYAWYEMYPAGTVASTIKVSPGDSITASVTYMGLNTSGVPSFKTHLEDLTTGKSFNSPTVGVPGAARASAEWIEEAPYYDGILGLTPVSILHFTGGSAVVGGVSEKIAGGGVNTFWVVLADYYFPYVSTTKYVKAEPSALNSVGSGFAMTFYSSGP